MKKIYQGETADVLLEFPAEDWQGIDLTGYGIKVVLYDRLVNNTIVTRLLADLTVTASTVKFSLASADTAAWLGTVTAELKLTDAQGEVVIAKFEVLEVQKSYVGGIGR